MSLVSRSERLLADSGPSAHHSDGEGGALLFPPRSSASESRCLARAVPSTLHFLAVANRRLVDLGPVRERAASGCRGSCSPGTSFLCTPFPQAVLGCYAHTGLKPNHMGRRHDADKWCETDRDEGRSGGKQGPG